MGPSNDDLDRYIELLGEHRTTWPDQPSANAVCWQIARLAEAQGQLVEAIEAYYAIRPDFAEFAEVVSAAGRCSMARLNQLRALGEPTTEPAGSFSGTWFMRISLKSSL